MILENPVFKISHFTLTEDELIGLANQNILAGKNRVFSVPWPEGLHNGELSATIILDAKR